MLYLAGNTQQELNAHLETAYPNEGCGFLVGTVSGETKTVTRLFAVDNAWANSEAGFVDIGDDFAEATRRERFFISAQDYLRVDKAAREQGETIIGFYHSHPDSPARPSAYDLALAQEIFPGYSYIIVSVIDSKAGDLTAWTLKDDYSAFVREAVRALLS